MLAEYKEINDCLYKGNVFSTTVTGATTASTEGAIQTPKQLVQLTNGEQGVSGLSESFS